MNSAEGPARDKRSREKACTRRRGHAAAPVAIQFLVAHTTNNPFGSQTENLAFFMLTAHHNDERLADVQREGQKYFSLKSLN